MQACDRCHSRKTRCDRRLPSCTACEKAGAPCLHRDKLRQRHLPRGYVDGIEDRLQNLTEENARLQRQLTALRNERGQSHQNDGPGEVTHVQNHLTPQSPPDTTRDAVSNEVGFLSLQATGETRYIGSSSGIALAGIISQMLDSATRRALITTEMRDTDSASPHSVLDTGDSSVIPPQKSAKTFIDAYFQHTHITFPLLHQTTFLQVVDKIYSQPDYYSQHIYDSFVFDMVLAIGSSNFNRFGDASAASGIYYTRAQAKLPTVLQMPGLMPLRAILLLSQHGIFSNLRDTSASIWHLIGIGARICYEMGLHIEPRRRSAVPETLDETASFENEMNRRCFWCLYNLDRVVSFTLGRPAAIKDEDIDVALPSPLSDDEFGPGTPLPATQDRRQTPFLHLIRIRRLSGQIFVTFYSASNASSRTIEEKIRLRRLLHDQVIAWKDDTAHINLQTQSHLDGQFKSCFLSLDWYTAVFNNAVLLLYRPSPSFPHSASSSIQLDEEGGLFHQLSAARATIQAYARLHSNRRLNYSWITLHGVFIAGLAYVYCVGRALKSQTSATQVPHYLHIIDDTRACSNILVAICERWNVVRRSCDLFNKLSSAVIRDAVAASIQPHSQTGLRDDGSMGQRVDQPSNVLNIDGNPTYPSNQMPSLDNNALQTRTGEHTSPSEQLFATEAFEHRMDAFDDVSSSTNPFHSSDLLMGFSQNWSFDEFFGGQSQNILHMQPSMDTWH